MPESRTSTWNVRCGEPRSVRLKLNQAQNVGHGALRSAKGQVQLPRPADMLHRSGILHPGGDGFPHRHRSTIALPDGLGAVGRRFLAIAQPGIVPRQPCPHDIADDPKLEVERIVVNHRHDEVRQMRRHQVRLESLPFRDVGVGSQTIPDRKARLESGAVADIVSRQQGMHVVWRPIARREDQHVIRIGFRTLA